MEITERKFEVISIYLPKQRGNVAVDNFKFVNGLLYIIENGCKWRALPKVIFA
ncbi:MAG: transposase [Clostridiales bacterium]|jgi:transposase|nr:transposase [Clostridiales bacterium]